MDTFLYFAMGAMQKGVGLEALRRVWIALAPGAANTHSSKAQQLEQRSQRSIMDDLLHTFQGYLVGRIMDGFVT